MNNQAEYTIFVQRIGLVGVAQFIVGLRGLVLLPILTKTLGAVDYGIWSQILVTISLLQPFVELGLPYSLLRFFSVKEKRVIGQGIITVLAVTFMTGIIATLAIFLLSDFLAINLLGNESAAVAIRLGSLLIILQSMNAILSSSFRMFGQIKRYSIILLLRFGLEIGLVSAAILLGYGLIGAIIALLISRSIALLITSYFIISHTGFSLPDFSQLRTYLAYGLPLVPTGLFSIVIASSDRYVIGFIIGAAGVGIYSAAYGIGSIISMFPAYLSYMLSPTAFSLHDRGEVEKTKRYFSYSWKYLMMFMIPSAFGLGVLAEPLLGSLTTDQFISTGRFVVPLVTFSMIFRAASTMFGHVVRLTKRTIIYPILYGAAALLNLGLNLLLVPYWGVTAAAITTLAAYLLTAIIMGYRSRKYLKFSINPSFIVKSILSSIIMASIIWVMNPTGIAMIILSIIIGVIIYFSIVFLVRGFSRKEVRFFIELIKETAGRLWIRR